MPAPENLKELQSFLGMVGYYGKFIPSMATLSEPLNELRRTGVKCYGRVGLWSGLVCQLKWHNASKT
uniref:Transposase n=1 Tax=Globodera pallida TaxID=36090 RepID=A0A183BQV5_GLOPA